MAIGALRVPVRIADSYVPTQDAQRLFPTFPCFLSREDILEVWPGGLITHEKFQHNGSLWRLVKRPMAHGNSVYMAVLDDSRTASHGTASSLGGTATTPDTAHRLRSLPLDAFSPDASDVNSGCCDVVPAYAHAAQHAPSAPSPLVGHGLRLPPPHSLGGSSMRDRNGSYSSMALAAAQPSGTLSVPSFMTDLLAATESPTPLDRYKAIVRLMSLLTRSRESFGLPQLTPRAPASAAADPAWDSPDAQDLVRQILLVGECLAKFGTADFVDGRNNSSRAITTKDYAKLLRMFLEGQGAAFRDDFIARLPLALQDEALTVRTLLQTRCETNDMLFNQLVKHVGQESTAGGGAVVYNNSTVSANPTNHMLAAPRTLVNTVSNAWSKADVKRRTQVGALGAVAVVALWVVKRKLFGGGGGRRSRREERDESEYGGGGGGSSRWSRRIRGSSDLAARLLDERLSAERMGARYVDACQEELYRAQRNIDLLKNDWRLGPLRLGLPGSGPVPPGYEELQLSHCSVASFMNALDGGVPFTMPYSSAARRPRAGAFGREAAPALAGAVGGASSVGE
ncbi:hypothetical protein GPECTOR_25g462 [Gonium pectorale]|uniref:Uncharacterized protein n=1 Tax=Gonium pectorale TaxID=33097 RepID=A0A150GGA9_GONPE|nr:hypothetical protein GPECTOR_25g462 [Gonium pectorale]|eukprot:KXZ48877.1 hypothetical protein GPECTOR_25g462 [Gonium pectorale]